LTAHVEGEMPRVVVISAAYALQEMIVISFSLKSKLAPYYSYPI
jgi:hypothetical protein